MKLYPYLEVEVTRQDEVAWMLIENSLDGGASFEEDNRR